MENAIKSSTEYENEITELKEENAELKPQLAVMKKLAFGQKSEKTNQTEESSEQLSLFNEAKTEQSTAGCVISYRGIIWGLLLSYR